MIASAALLAAISATLIRQGWMVYAEHQRERAAWRRVGSCEPVGMTERITCTGVHLVDLVLPPEIAGCSDAHVCTVKVNREALPAFQAALLAVIQEDLGEFVPQFQTVNRRRCRDGLTGGWIPDCVSKHSYGIAVDFRPFADNANWDSVVDLNPGISEVVAIFRRNGFRWGATFDNFDPQHLEWIPR